MEAYIIYIPNYEKSFHLPKKEKVETQKDLTYSINEDGDVVQNFSEKELLDHIRNGGGLPKLPKLGFKHNKFYFIQD